MAQHKPAHDMISTFEPKVIPKLNSYRNLISSLKNTITAIVKRIKETGLREKSEFFFLFNF